MMAVLVIVLNKQSTPVNINTRNGLIAHLDKALVGLVLILREKVFLSMLDNSTSRGKGESGLGLGLGRY